MQTAKVTYWAPCWSQIVSVSVKINRKIGESVEMRQLMSIRRDYTNSQYQDSFLSNIVETAEDVGV